MKIQVVLGTLFGDEGKGSTVQWLCNRAIEQGDLPLVVRFSGGPQAGHRIVYGKLEHICSSFGSGVLLGVPTYLTKEVMIDPISMKLEYEVLKSMGVTPQIFIHPQCRVITPYDVLCNLNDQKVLGDGSCGKGIFHAFSRYSNDSRQQRLCELKDYPDEYLVLVRNYWRQEPIWEYENMFVEAIQWLVNFAQIKNLPNSEQDYDTLIFEGSQGLLLDMEAGFMPHCTPSKVGLNGVKGTFDITGSEVFLVMRPYLTRHGNGYTPRYSTTAQEYFSFEEPSNTDDGYQGDFKRGFFEDRLLMRVCDRHRLDNDQLKYKLKVNMVVTHLDCMLQKDIIPHLTVDDKQAFDPLDVFLQKIRLATGLDINHLYGSYSQSLTENQFRMLS